jgi:aryl-alcohol dehydrogenase-like predicted oxidoreductase
LRYRLNVRDIPRHALRFRQSLLDEEGEAMETRLLGNTGARLSVLGFGGIVAAGKAQSETDQLLGQALDAGVTYVDVAPSYGDCEERVGPALAGRRDNVFLACKTTERTKNGSRAELERSLRRLQTDHFDLYQVHGITNMKEVETVFSPGGAMETFVEAQKEGKTRFIGFSAHSEEAALALMDGFAFDTILFPVNWVCWLKAGFGPRVIERAKVAGMGLLALKAMVRQVWPENARREAYPACWYQPEDDPVVASLALRFTWSQGVTACVPPGDATMWRLALELAGNTKTLAGEELQELRKRAADLSPIFPQ